MQAYLINLVRRPDRLRKMTEQLAGFDIALRLVPAVDAREVRDAEIDAAFARSGPLGLLSKGDKCCALSHWRAWEMFLASGDTHALVLEDDVEIDAEAAPWLRDVSWIPPQVGLLKIERFGPAKQRVLLTEMVSVDSRRRIGRILSKHTGAGAYILTREVARLLLDWPRPWTLSVDHMLFNPNNSPLFTTLQPYQLTPVIARQTQAIGGCSDIDEWRKNLRGMNWPRIQRKLVRAYYDLRHFPWQLAKVALGRAQFVRVDSGIN